jgi:signal transduction histidine kinase
MNTQALSPAPETDGGAIIAELLGRGVAEPPEDAAALRLELAAAYEELQKVERMREAMLSILGHELRTPLFAALLAAEELEPSAKEGRARCAHEHLKRNLLRLQTAAEEIIGHARRGAGKPLSAAGPACLETIARARVEEARTAAAAAGQSLSFEIHGHPRPILAVEADLARAIDHLLSNAIRFNRPGGRVRVELRFDASEAELTVADEGAGVPPSERGRIFDAYYQAADFMTRRAGGLGLGLAVARGVFESHGGAVRVAENPGGGSVFRATLPLAAA